METLATFIDAETHTSQKPSKKLLELLHTNEFQDMKTHQKV
jgi:hypothetical protein